MLVRRKNKNFLSILKMVLVSTSVFLIALFCLVNLAAAQSDGDTYQQAMDDLMLPGIGVEVRLVETVVNIINIFLGLLGLVGVVLIIYGGFIWMTAGGDPTKVDRAKKIIINALIGLAVVILSFIIVSLVIGAVHGWAEGQVDHDPNPPVGPPVLPPHVTDPRQLRINEVQTSHAGVDDASDVRLCSNIQTIFSNQLTDSSFEDARNGSLRIVQQTAAGEVLFSESDNWRLINRYISYEVGMDNLFEENATYHLYVPTSLQDVLGNNLSNCLASPACTALPGAFRWTFQTGVEVDDVPPEVTRTTPAALEENVSLSPYVKITFNEPIDILSVNETSVRVFDQQGNQIDFLTEFNFDDKAISFGFENDLSEFEQYQVVVGGVRDLCGNQMEADYSWRFRVGNSGAALSGNYPEGGDVCPDEHLLFNFNSSMEAETVRLTVNGGDQNLSLELLPGERSVNVTGVGRLIVTNDRFTAYEFEPANFFQSQSAYTVVVETTKQINIAGDLLEASWTFNVTTEESCSCRPYISYLSPSSGNPGDCLTVFGRCFTGYQQMTAEPVTVNFNAMSVGVNPGSFSERSIVTRVPATFVAGDAPQVSVTTAYAASGERVTSNQRVFNVMSDSVAGGPCLLSLSPTTGNRGRQVMARGEQFGDTAGDLIFFNNQAADINEWQTTGERIEAKVPLLAEDGNVFVQDIFGRSSNELFFDVTDNYDTPTDDGYLRVINDGRCEIEDSSITVYPSPNPYKKATNICRNAVISARFNKLVNNNTLNNQSVQVVECADTENDPTIGGCDNATPVVGSVTVFVYDHEQEGFVFRPNGLLSSEHYYQVTLRSGLIQAEDGTQLPGDYSWFFKTQVSTEECPLAYVDVQPANYHTRSAALEIPYRAAGFADRCQEISSNFSWNWSSTDVAVAGVTADAQDSSLASAHITAYENPGETRIVAEALGENDYGLLSYDPDICRSDVDCTDYYGDGSYLCPGSVCDDESKRCTPVINSLNPDEGPVGRWLTVLGCYFGNSRGGGQVLFGEQEATFPCAGGWRDRSIVVEVPSDPGDRVSMVTNNDLASNEVDFNLISSCTTAGVAVPTGGVPGICSIGGEFLEVTAYTNISGHNLLNLDEEAEILPPFRHQVNFNSLTANSFRSWTDKKINVQVPQSAVAGELVVEIENCPSNALPYALIGQSCDGEATAGCQLNQAMCGPQLVCEPTSCSCELPAAAENGRVIDESIMPIGDATCPNALVAVTFDRVMSASTINNDTFQVLRIINSQQSQGQKNNFLSKLFDQIKKWFGYLAQAQQTSELVAGSVRKYQVESGIRGCTNEDGCTVAEFSASNLFVPNARYRVSLEAGEDGMRTAEGGLLNANSGSYYSWDFGVGDEICEFDSVEIVPSRHVFNAASTTQLFVAQAMKGEEIIITSASYPFSWQWSKADAGNIISDVNSQTDSQSVTSQNENGRATIYATASTTDATLSVSQQQKISGSANITNFLCENPEWIIDNNAASHYQTFYCRDGETFVPSANQRDTAVAQLDAETLAEKFVILFDEDDAPTGDVVGIRVFANRDRLSPEEWYLQKTPNAIENPSKLNVAGYEAIKVGRTVYVAGSNVSGNNVYSNIYLMSYNDRASSATIKIFNELVDNWEFNENLDVVEKEQLLRDTQRINALGDIKTYLTAYEQQYGNYPTLAVGTYKQGKSTSAWPSWQQTLAGQLGHSLPVDPLNTFCYPDYGEQSCDSLCPAGNGYDPLSCWNEAQKDFICPDGSHIYQYQVREGGAAYSLYANMEFRIWNNNDSCVDYEITN